VRRASPEGVSIKGQKRIALVIGNNEYKEDRLRNPAHDAEDIGKVLRELGFTVQTKINANPQEMEEAVKEFVREIQNGDVGLFYFSGHGVQVDGENYLIPVGVSIESAPAVRHKAISAGYILEEMHEARNRTNIFILDACRNNPFKGFRSMNKGLATMDAPKGTFIAYATAPESVAADGTGRNSPFTKHLIQSVQKKDMQIEQVFKEIMREVRKETEGKQVPWTASSLQDDFWFNPGDTSLQASTPMATSPLELDRPHQASLTPPTPTSLGTEKVERGRLGVNIQDLNESLAKSVGLTDTKGALVQSSEQGSPAEKAGIKADDVILDYNGLPVTSATELKNMVRTDKPGSTAKLTIFRDKKILYVNATIESEVDRVDRLQRLAHQGDAKAQANLGVRYKDGNGVSKDYSEAMKWFNKSANQGNAGAQNWLGVMYQNGFGVAKDYEEAVKWYRKAVDQGYPPGQLNLGWMYQNGFGVAKDYSEAVKWYMKAAEQGEVSAQRNLGLMYRDGLGVPKDKAEARKWFTKAADRGNVSAKNELQNLGATSSK